MFYMDEWGKNKLELMFYVDSLKKNKETQLVSYKMNYPNSRKTFKTLFFLM